jgi:hypothetical protein
LFSASACRRAMSCTFTAASCFCLISLRFYSGWVPGASACLRSYRPRAPVAPESLMLEMSVTSALPRPKRAAPPPWRTALTRQLFLISNQKRRQLPRVAAGSD